MHRLVADGYQVATLDITPAEHSHSYTVDVTGRTQIDSALADIRAQLDPVTILVNARACAFLISDEAGYITGQIIGAKRWSKHPAALVFRVTGQCARDRRRTLLVGESGHAVAPERVRATRAEIGLGATMPPRSKGEEDLVSTHPGWSGCCFTPMAVCNAEAVRPDRIPSSEGDAAPAAHLPRPPAVGAGADALVLGVLAFLVSLAGAGRPSLWVDEAATVSATTRSPDELWALVQHVDLVHGLYYLLMHGWALLTPPTEAWLRLPSAVLVGVATAGVVALGRQFSGRSVGIAAAVVFAVLPRTTWAGIEARPYALTMACAVWLTVLLVVALRRGGTWWWIAYGSALVVSVVVNVVVLLLVGVHAIMVVGSAQSRRLIAAWAVSTIAAVVVVLPLVTALLPQQAQVGWIWRISGVTVGQIIGEQYFPSVYADSLRAVGPDQQQLSSEQLWVAMHAWARVAPLISVVVILAVLAVWKVRHGTTEVQPGSRLLVSGCAAWILVPTVVLVGYSVAVRPIYQPHYLSFTTPALALLIGLCVVLVGRESRRIAALLVVIGLAALPNYLAQRSEFAKYGSDYSQVADLLAAHATPGDCLMIDETVGPSATDGIEGARLQHADGLIDIGLDQTAGQRDALFGARVPVQDRADALRSCTVVWVVTDRRTDDRPASRREEEWASLGLRPAKSWQFNQSEVLRADNVRAGR